MLALRRLPGLALHGFALVAGLAAGPAAAGTTIIDGDTTGPVSVISGDEIEVLPTGRITSLLEGIVGAGDNEVVIRREGVVQGDVWGLRLGGGSSVLNQGRIDGGVYGIQIEGVGVIHNSNKIMGGTFGIFGSSDLEVINDGKLSGGVFGIETLGSIHLINRGSITGGVFGVQALRNGSIRNWGSISGGTFGIQTIENLDLYNWGTIRGGVFGVQAIGSADVRNWGGIEGGIFGLQALEGGRLWNWGRINGGIFGVQFLGGASVYNFNTIEGGQFGLFIDGGADVWNYGRITGGDFGLLVQGASDVRNWGLIRGGDFGVQLFGAADVRNWGQIEGGQFGLLTSGGDARIWNWGLVRGGLFGVLADGNAQIHNYGAVDGGDFGIGIQGRGAVYNHGTITGRDFGVSFGQTDNLFYNYGVVRGGESSVAAQNGGKLTLGGTGYWIGDVSGSPVNDDDVLRLDLVGVPKEVKQSLLRRQGALGGPLQIPVFNIHARDFEFLEIERLISFEEEAGGDFGSVGRALDWRDVTRDGSKSAFVEGFAGIVTDPQAYRDALENVSGRAISHSASDMAFANSYLWNQDLSHYLDLKRDKGWADQKSGLETSGWGGFAKGTGIFADQDRTSHRQDGDWTVHGAYLGGDYTFEDRVTLGAFGGYTRSEADVDDFGSTLSSDDLHGGVYGGCMHGPVQIDGALWYSNHDYDVKRELALPTFEQRSQAAFDADQLSTYLRASWNWRPALDERLEISPRIKLDYSHLWLDGWKEESSVRRLGLVMDDQEADSLRTSLGARVSGRFDIGKLTLQPEIRADWVHEYLDDGRSIAARWRTGAFGAFQTESEVDDRDSAVLGAGVTVNVPVCPCMQKLELYAGYDAQLGRDEFRAHVVNVELNYQF